MCVCALERERERESLGIRMKKWNMEPASQCVLKELRTKIRMDAFDSLSKRTKVHLKYLKQLTYIKSDAKNKLGFTSHSYDGSCILE